MTLMLRIRISEKLRIFAIKKMAGTLKLENSKYESYLYFWKSCEYCRSEVIFNKILMKNVTKGKRTGLLNLKYILSFLNSTFQHFEVIKTGVR